MAEAKKIDKKATSPEAETAAPETKVADAPMAEMKEETMAPKSEMKMEETEAKTEAKAPAAKKDEKAEGYAKGSITKWVIIYIILGLLIYGAIYYFTAAKGGSTYTSTTTSNQSY